MTGALKGKFKAFKPYIPIVALMIVVLFISLLIKYPEIPEVEEAAEEFKKNEPSIWQPTGYHDDTQISGVVNQSTVSKVTKDNKTEEDANTGDKSLVYLINVAIFLGIAIAAAFGILLLFKLRKRLTIKWFFQLAMGIVAVASLFIIIYFLYLFLYYTFDVNYNDIYLLLFGIPISFFGGIAIIMGIAHKRSTTKIRNNCLLALCALISIFLVIILHEGFILILVIGISIWDIYATMTKHGPIKQIIEITDQDAAEVAKKKKALREAQLKQQQEELAKKQAEATKQEGAKPIPPPPADEAVITGAPPIMEAKTPAEPKPEQQPPSPKKLITKTDEDLQVIELFGLYDAPDLQIGMGDLIFYSVLTATIAKYFLFFLPYYGFYTPLLGLAIPLYVAIFAGIAVIGGFLKTIQLLDAGKILPGLPISMFIGVGCFILNLVVLQILNLITYGNLVPIF